MWGEDYTASGSMPRGHVHTHKLKLLAVRTAVDLGILGLRARERHAKLGSTKRERVNNTHCSKLGSPSVLILDV